MRQELDRLGITPEWGLSGEVDDDYWFRAHESAHEARVYAGCIEPLRNYLPFYGGYYNRPIEESDSDSISSMDFNP